MTEQERDSVLIELRDTQRDHGEKLDALSDQLQDVARAVREIGGDVADEPDDEQQHEATG